MHTCSRCNPESLPNCLLMHHVDCNLQIDFRISRIVTDRIVAVSQKLLSLYGLYMRNSYQGVVVLLPEGVKTLTAVCNAFRSPTQLSNRRCESSLLVQQSLLSPELSRVWKGPCWPSSSRQTWRKDSEVQEIRECSGRLYTYLCTIHTYQLSIIDSPRLF